MIHAQRLFEVNDSIHPLLWEIGLLVFFPPLWPVPSPPASRISPPEDSSHSSSPVPPHSLGVPCPGLQSSLWLPLCCSTPCWSPTWASAPRLPLPECYPVLSVSQPNPRSSVTSTWSRPEVGGESPSLPTSPTVVSSGLKSSPLTALCVALEQALAVSCLSYSKFLTGILARDSPIHSAAKRLFLNTNLISFSP